MGTDWFVNNDGSLQQSCLEGQSSPVLSPSFSLSPRPYRLYRFLTDVEDVLDQIKEDELRLKAIVPLVRKFLSHTDWLSLISLEPDPETGWAVLMLYDEPLFPLTVQLVSWAPGVTSPIHNHATWGIVALLSGQEKNTIWSRSSTLEYPDRIEIKDHCLLNSDDILCFMPDAIHHVEAIGDQPTISFNLYGETDYSRRREFDPTQNTATLF